jgi:endonuclease/exonuclease/phosphatase family metal-dependent hydrolase
VQTLFDGVDHGNEYMDYRTGAGWNGEKYEARLLELSQAMAKMAGKGAPDFIGLVEIENEGVLRGLVSAGLSKAGYTHAFFGGAQGASLGIGIVSRLPFTARLHSAYDGTSSSPRPLVEARVETEEGTIYCLVAHWKSKLGGEDSTEDRRRADAGMARRRLEEIAREEPGAPVIIMGDLNENHDDFFRRAQLDLCALLPDDSSAARVARGRDGYLVLSGEKPPKAASFGDTLPALYSPWYDGLEGGTFWYKGAWETIDHILLSKEFFNGEGWEYGGIEILNRPPFSGSSGRPWTYVPKTGRGISDHLPLLLRVANTGDEALSRFR